MTDPLFYFLKGECGENAAKAMIKSSAENALEVAKNLGFEPPVEEEPVVDSAALVKAIKAVEDAGARQPSQPKVEDVFGDVVAHAAEAAQTGDATGLLKSLADGTTGAFAGFGQTIDDLGAQIAANNTLGQVTGHGFLRMAKSIEQQSQAIRENTAELRGIAQQNASLLKALGQPEAARSAQGAFPSEPTPRGRALPAPRFPAPPPVPNTDGALTKSEAKRILSAALRKANAEGDDLTMRRITDAFPKVETANGVVDGNTAKFITTLKNAG